MNRVVTFLVIAFAAFCVWQLVEISVINNHWGTDVGVPTENVKNTSYSVGDKMVTLVNGVSEVEAVPGWAETIVTRYFGNEAHGDVDRDGRSDTVFLFTQTMGGSGTFYYVAVALNEVSGIRGTNAVLLGDRIAPQTTEIKNGEIVVNYADRKRDEPMTVQPSVGVSRHFVVENGVLIEK